MKSKKLLILLLFLGLLGLSSCEIDKDEERLETLVSYMEKLKRGDLAKIIKGSGFRAAIVYQDEDGNYQPLTFDGCYRAFVNAGYDKKFSYQFCQYLIYTALNKVLEKRANQLEPEVRAFLKEYRQYIKEKEKLIEHIKKVVLYSIPIFFAIVGLIVGVGVYKLMNIKAKEEELKQKAYRVEEGLKLYKQQKEEEAREIVAKATREAEQIIDRAREEAEYIKGQAYERGYEEGREKHKKELKALRGRLAAVRDIFKAKPELNECFKQITGWDFEKWLKER